jgi:hypothetical protein
MVKFSMTNENGDRAYVIGLSKKNWEHLLANEPIAFAVENSQVPIKFLIVVGGETEESITEELAKHFPFPKPENAS